MIVNQKDKVQLFAKFIKQHLFITQKDTYQVLVSFFIYFFIINIFVFTFSILVEENLFALLVLFVQILLLRVLFLLHIKKRKQNNLMNYLLLLFFLLAIFPVSKYYHQLQNGFLYYTVPLFFTFAYVNIRKTMIVILTVSILIMVTPLLNVYFFEINFNNIKELRFNIWHEIFYTIILLVAIYIVVNSYLRLKIVEKENFMRLNKKLGLLNGKLKTSKKYKDDFYNQMSFEIRTPINALLGSAQILLKSNLSGTQMKFIEVIDSNSKNLIVLLDDLLILSKIQLGKSVINQNPMILHSIVKIVYFTNLTMAENKGLKLILNTDPKIYTRVVGDSSRISQILMNLIGNAIKFTNKGSVEISVNVVNENKKHLDVEFIVKDTGIGISEEFLETIFEEFTQEKRMYTSDTIGTGLGLNLSKKLASLMGGEIKISSVLNEGTTAVFRLKLNIIQELVYEDFKVTNNDVDVKNKLENLTILLVEDSPSNSLVAKFMLENEGATVYLAENGYEAEKILTTTSSKINVILMDLNLPYKSGYETVEYITKKLKLQIPIIAITASTSYKEKLKCMSLGFKDFITKPFQAKQIVDSILKHVNTNNLKN